VRLLWKILQFGAFAGLTILATGCGGFHAKYGVTPLSFLLPGLVKVDSQAANSGQVKMAEDRKELAQTENSLINF
jgi:hypothetical protein